MIIFGTDATSSPGCFMVLGQSLAEGHGSVLKLPNGLEVPRPNAQLYPAIITSVDITQIEQIFYLKCFNNRVYTYTFGNDVGSVKINYLLFFAGGAYNGPDYTGSGSSSAARSGVESGALPFFFKSYANARASKSRQMATLSFGGQTTNKMVLRGLVRGMQSSTLNVETNIQGFSFALDVLEVQGGDV